MIDAIGFIVGVIGTLIILDGLYSYFLYRDAESYRGDPQTWARDHWVRAVRSLSGVVLIVLGWLLVV